MHHEPTASGNRKPRSCVNEVFLPREGFIKSDVGAIRHEEIPRDVVTWLALFACKGAPQLPQSGCFRVANTAAYRPRGISVAVYLGKCPSHVSFEIRI